ncbi:WD40/YVTN/BNR-like repeat-containing protein [Amycolatopsis aidingensis]|uniref:WD40/YVTN/BNR-like repeat-containing protein n=1 Tax=Amycolatopsis aidingensis TaxID=2842453 RepID=UPI001C0D1B6A|nr:glycoside hydrolase [Amycolatopsis aidingensis]
MDVLLGIGTRKGMWFARSRDGRASWELTGPHYPVDGVRALTIDTRGPSPRVLAGVVNEHFGTTVVISTDLGQTWHEPEQAPIAFPEDADAALQGIWQLAPGPVDQPDVVYAGVEPHGLFRSEDGGRSFELVRGLWEHPHRKQWMPGGGGACLHTVIPHPTNADRVTVGISAGGVYRTADGGRTWEPGNAGIQAVFLPEDQRYPEFGQCVHKLAINPSRPDRYFLQNHHGVYRSEDDTRSWQSIAEGLPDDFGFPMVAHPHRPEVIYNFPLVSSEFRFPPAGRCRVYRSEDAGDTWTALSTGLPEEGFWAAVMRDAMCTDDADPAGVYFGSRSGEVWCTPDEGEHWQLVAQHLPDVLCVRAAVV